MDPLTNILFIVGLIVVFMFSVILHENAHGYVAYKCGDLTPVMQGRLSLNPLKHIDWLGLLAFLLIGIGWAKPVTINPYNLEDVKTCTIKISLAGPATNFVLAFLFAFLVKLFPIGVLAEVFHAGVVLNIFLGLFNLIPVWPLDGYNALIYILPAEFAKLLDDFKYFSFAIFFVLLYSGIINTVLEKIVQLLFGFLI